MTAGKMLKVGVVRLPHAADLPLPAYQSDEAAGLDIVAAVAVRSPVTLRPGERVLIPTGLLLELPRGSEAQVRPRSGLAFKHGITVLNSPGTIDSDYRGELQVLLVNLGQEPFVVRRGERIAQLVVAMVSRIRLTEKKSAAATRRGAAGFGSTGTATVAKKLTAASSGKANSKTSRPKRKTSSRGKPTVGRKSR